MIPFFKLETTMKRRLKKIAGYTILSVLFSALVINVYVQIEGDSVLEKALWTAGVFIFIAMIIGLIVLAANLINDEPS